MTEETELKYALSYIFYRVNCPYCNDEFEMIDNYPPCIYECPYCGKEIQIIN